MEEDVLLRLRLVGEKKTSSLSDMTTTPAPRPSPSGGVSRRNSSYKKSCEASHLYLYA